MELVNALQFKQKTLPRRRSACGGAYENFVSVGQYAPFSTASAVSFWISGS